MSTYTKAIERPKLRGSAGVSPINPSAASARPLIAQLEQDAERTQAEYDRERNQAFSRYSDDQQVAIREVLADIHDRHPDDPAALKQAADAALGPILSGAEEVSPTLAAGLRNSASAQLTSRIAQAGAAQRARQRDEAQASFETYEASARASVAEAVGLVTSGDPSGVVAGANALGVAIDQYVERASGNANFDETEKGRAVRGFAAVVGKSFVGGLLSKAKTPEEVQSLMTRLRDGSLELPATRDGKVQRLNVQTLLGLEDAAVLEGMVADRYDAMLKDRRRIARKAEKDYEKRAKEARDANEAAILSVIYEGRKGDGSAPDIQPQEVIEALRGGLIDPRAARRLMRAAVERSESRDRPEVLSDLENALDRGVDISAAGQDGEPSALDQAFLIDGALKEPTYVRLAGRARAMRDKEVRGLFNALSGTMKKTNAVGVSLLNDEQALRVNELLIQYKDRAADAIAARDEGRQGERLKDIYDSVMGQYRLMQETGEDPRNMTFVVYGPGGEPDWAATRDKIMADADSGAITTDELQRRIDLIETATRARPPGAK